MERTEKNKNRAPAFRSPSASLGRGHTPASATVPSPFPPLASPRAVDRKASPSCDNANRRHPKSALLASPTARQTPNAWCHFATANLSVLTRSGMWWNAVTCR